MGRSITDLETATSSRVSFIIRFGSGILPDRKTVIQAQTRCTVAAVSGTVAESGRVAGNPPPSDE